jgi:DNA-binding NtrC family response regulator
MEGETQWRILVVEDEPALARVYARALAAAGFEVDVADNGMDGLNRLLGVSYDVVVSDVCMPRMNGLRLLESIRRLRPDVPVVMMTAQFDADAYDRARELGTVRYLLKPFTLDQLAKAVRNATMLRKLWQRQTARRHSVR